MGNSADMNNGATTMSAEERARIEAQQMAEEQARQERERARMLLGKTVFYFDFDQSTIHPEDHEALEAHAQCIRSMNSSVVLEGHTDERGTREYNLALGERRAESIERYLSVQGVSNQAIEKISFGEERPTQMGHDESSWSRNRRVEIRYESGDCLS